MQNQHETSSTHVQRARASIELILFGFMVSLTLKAGLDTAYSNTVTTAVTWWDLYQFIWILPSLQLLIFLITLIRFVYGAYRTLEVIEDSSEELEGWILIWNIPGMLMLFILFYITSLSVQHSEPFYAGMILIHLWDSIWFLLPAFLSNKLNQKMKTVMGKFLLIDILTMALLILIFIIKPSGIQFAIIGAILMVILAILDFWWNREFFFHRAEWKATS